MVVDAVCDMRHRHDAHRGVQHSLGPAVIDVKPLVWTEWYTSQYAEDNGYTTRPYCYSLGMVTHWLTELGATTNNYRYTAHYKRTLLATKVISPECCSGLRKCPIKHYHQRGTHRGKQLPLTPCREVLRLQALEEAQRVWVQFVRTIADNIQP